MELRKLKSTDLFLTSNIISKIGLKNIKNTLMEDLDLAELKSKIIDNPTEYNEQAVENYGLAIMVSVGDLVLSKLSIVQDDLIKFISNLTGLSIKEVEDLPITDFTELIIEIIKMPDFTDFIKVVLRLSK